MRKFLRMTLLTLAACLIVATASLAADTCATVETKTMFLEFVDSSGNTTTAVLQVSDRQYLLDPDTGERYVWFTPEQALSIRQSLAGGEFSDEMLYDALLTTKLAVPNVDRTAEIGGLANLGAESRPSFVFLQKELEPECGECLNGQLCNEGGEITCCTEGGNGCSKCRECEDDDE